MYMHDFYENEQLSILKKLFFFSRKEQQTFCISSFLSESSGLPLFLLYEKSSKIIPGPLQKKLQKWISRFIQSLLSVFMTGPKNSTSNSTLRK